MRRTINTKLPANIVGPGREKKYAVSIQYEDLACGSYHILSVTWWLNGVHVNFADYAFNRDPATGQFTRPKLAQAIESLVEGDMEDRRRIDRDRAADIELELQREGAR